MFSRPFAPARALFLYGMLAASLFGLVSCGKEDEDETASVPLAATYESLWSNLFSGRCNTCHAPGKNLETANGPDMSTKDSFYAALVNKKGSDYPQWETFSNNRESCASFNFIKPNDAAGSMVVGVLDIDNAPCTVLDHQETGKVSTTSEIVTLLKDWINKGAAR